MNLKRLIIYFFYDEYGIIDEYVYYMLNDLRKNSDYIFFVSNGKLEAESREKVSAYCYEVIERENVGFDVWAYKTTLENQTVQKLLQSEIDELVLMNYTIMGPVYPLEETFSKMDAKSLDFWGITAYFKYCSPCEYKTKYGYLPTHIQSHFIAFRKSLFLSNDFSNYWNSIPKIKSYRDSVSKNESVLTKHFEELGYRWDLSTDSFETEKIALCPIISMPTELIRDYKCPIFKRRSFFNDYDYLFLNTFGEASVKLIRFIEKQTNYDANLIWETILRTSNLADVVRNAQLNRVLPRNMIVNTNGCSLKVGLVFHMYYEELFDESISYLSNFPHDVSIQITTDSESKKLTIDKKLSKAKINARVTIIENRGRDVSSLLVGVADFIFDFDLICFAHEKKSSHVKPLSAGRAWAYKLNENMFATKEYISNIINVFENEERLGIAFPSYPNHGVYSHSIGTGWGKSYNITQKLLNDFKINVKINEHSLCVSPLGTCFWFRPRVLEKLFSGYDGNGWSCCDFPKEPTHTDGTILHAIERSYAYFAQDSGYYPVFLYNDKSAEIELTNLEYSRSFYIEHGIKHTLKIMLLTLRTAHPRVWNILHPFRRIAKKILSDKTRM